MPAQAYLTRKGTWNQVVGSQLYRSLISRLAAALASLSYHWQASNKHVASCLCWVFRSCRALSEMSGLDLAVDIVADRVPGLHALEILVVIDT